MLLFTDRATKSYTQLKYAFGEKDLAMGEGAQLFSNTDPNESENKAWQELQHNHAGLKLTFSGFVSIYNGTIYNVPCRFFTVNQLKALLRQQEEKETETSPSRRRRMSPTVSIILFFLFKETNNYMPDGKVSIEAAFMLSHLVNHIDVQQGINGLVKCVY